MAISRSGRLGSSRENAFCYNELRGLVATGSSRHMDLMVILRPSLPRKIMGWAMLALGVLGLVLPFLQGFLFLAYGVFTLRDQHIWAARRWAWVAGRWPEMVGKLEAMELRMLMRMRHFAARLRLRS
ncbi:MAG: PGPGW domain-containing protein [Alphaproteobacteria bacterium]